MSRVVIDDDRGTDVNPGDELSRRNWSLAAAAVLSNALTPEGLYTIVSRGRDEFIRIARQEFVGHGFRQEDFNRIWKVLLRKEAANARNGRR